jgi:hypothetical protein
VKMWKFSNAFPNKFKTLISFFSNTKKWSCRFLHMNSSFILLGGEKQGLSGHRETNGNSAEFQNWTSHSRVEHSAYIPLLSLQSTTSSIQSPSVWRSTNSPLCDDSTPGAADISSSWYCVSLRLPSFLLLQGPNLQTQAVVICKQWSEITLFCQIQLSKEYSFEVGRVVRMFGPGF